MFKGLHEILLSERTDLGRILCNEKNISQCSPKYWERSSELLGRVYAGYTENLGEPPSAWNCTSQTILLGEFTLQISNSLAQLKTPVKRKHLSQCSFYLPFQGEQSCPCNKGSLRVGHSISQIPTSFLTVLPGGWGRGDELLVAGHSWVVL